MEWVEVFVVCMLGKEWNGVRKSGKEWKGAEWSGKECNEVWEVVGRSGR